MIRRFLLSCFSFGHCNADAGEGCIAVAEITPMFAGWSEAKRVIFVRELDRDLSLRKMCYEATHIKYYRDDEFYMGDGSIRKLLTFEERELFKTYGIIELKADVQVPDERGGIPIERKVEGGMIAVYEKCVAWTAVISGTEVRLETETIPFDRFLPWP